MKEIKINIEGCTEDVAKVLKYLEQGGFLTQKNMSSGINKEGMNTTATYEVMPEDSEDRTEIEPFMPKKGEVCAFICRDNDNPDIIFIATGKKYGSYYLMGFVSIELSYKLMHPYRICTNETGDSLAFLQEHCRPATSEEIDLLFKALKDEGYSWDPIGCKRLKDKYEPNYKERYFAPDFDATDESPFSVVMYEWQGLDYDMDLLKKGWVFRTEAEAQALCDKLNKAVEGVEV